MPPAEDGDGGDDGYDGGDDGYDGGDDDGGDDDGDDGDGGGDDGDDGGDDGGDHDDGGDGGDEGILVAKLAGPPVRDGAAVLPGPGLQTYVQEMEIRSACEGDAPMWHNVGRLCSMPPVRRVQ